MTEELQPCKYCHCKKAETFKVGDLYYVRCKGTKKVKVKDPKTKEVSYITKACTSWDRYEFLGFTEKSAIENWNMRNTMTGQGYPKKKKE